MKNKYTFRYVLGGIAFGIAFPIIGSLVEIIASGSSISFESFMIVQAQKPLLWIIDTAPLFLGLFAGLIGARQDQLNQQNLKLEAEISARREAYVEIENLKNYLDQEVKNRTKSLERIVLQLRASAEVSQKATTVLNPNQLSEQVVELIKNRFELYYVGLFLLDNQNVWCHLVAGTGEAGKIMLENKHRIKIGEGMIGWCVENNQARIALDVGSDAVRFENPELPDTRSEGALPLHFRDRVIGALTIQSKEAAAFDQESITVLQTMADQIAIALENAELIARYEASLKAERRAYGELSHQAWRKLLEKSEIGFISSEMYDIQSVEREWSPAMRKTATSGQITYDGENTILIPIVLREQTLGVVRLAKQEGSGSWSENEVELMNTLVDQLETALETARLYSNTQIQAERERLTHEVTDKLHRSPDMDALMKTLLQEISTALGASSAFVQLSAEQRSGKKGNGSKRGTGYLPPLGENAKQPSTPEETLE